MEVLFRGAGVIVLLVSGLTTSTGAPCASDEDCSLNGLCVSGVCACDPAWTGDRCSVLSFMPAEPNTGYWLGGDPQMNHSSWGGGGWYDETDKVWYLWVSEMSNNCGMATWTSNSRTVRAASSNPVGLYIREGVQFPVWTHESIVTRGPAGEYVAFMSYRVSDHPLHEQCTGCTGGSTSPNCTKLEADATQRSGISSRDPTYMSWAPAGGARGEWSDPVLVLQEAPQMDTNMAAVINANGSLVGMWRDHHLTPDRKGKSTIHQVTASNWKDNTTYQWTVTDLLFGDENLTYPGGVEDPFLWIDQRGNYHALFHILYGGHPYQSGGHAYSSDGLRWIWTGEAYDGNVTWAAGSEVGKLQANGDRPHLIFDKDGHTPVALTNSGSTHWGATGMDPDQTITLLRPLHTKTSRPIVV